MVPLRGFMFNSGTQDQHTVWKFGPLYYTLVSWCCTDWTKKCKERLRDSFLNCSAENQSLIIISREIMVRKKNFIKKYRDMFNFHKCPHALLSSLPCIYAHPLPSILLSLQDAPWFTFPRLTLVHRLPLKNPHTTATSAVVTTSLDKILQSG